MTLKPIADDTKHTGTKSPIIAATDMSFDPVDVQDPIELEGMDVGEISGKVTSGLDLVDQSLSRLREINQSRLKGKLPADIQNQLRTQSAEASQMLGIGADSPAARALTARDVGATSLQLQDAGVQTQMGIDQLQAGVAEIQQKRAEFSAQFTESTRQFNETLALDQNRFQMSVKELMLKRDQFNTELNAQIIGYMTNLMGTRATAGAQIVASGKHADSAVFGGLDNMLLQMNRQLEIYTGKA